MKKFLITLILLIPFVTFAKSTNDMGMISTSTQFRSLIDIPTAGVSQKGEYDFEMRIFAEGGILMGFNVGLFNRFNMGISYGGTGIIGNSADIGWNDEPGVEVKYRLFDESYFFPAVALGYSSQGYGGFETNDSTEVKRYLIKSRGLYAVFSKNFQYRPGKDLGLHIGMNYNTNERDDDQGTNCFIGSDFALNEELTLIGEYDLALNDNSDKAFGEGQGYFNFAVRWTFASHMMLQLDLKDILGNYRASETVSREIKIVYKQKI